MTYALIAGVDPRFGLYSAIVVTLVASIFGSSSHLINGPTNAISLVVFSSLSVFDVPFDAAKAGESGHSVLVHPVGNHRPERPVRSVSRWSRYAPRCPAPVQSDQRVTSSRKWICWWNS